MLSAQGGYAGFGLEEDGAFACEFLQLLQVLVAAVFFVLHFAGQGQLGQGEGPFLGVFAGEWQGFVQPVGGFAGLVEGEAGAGFEVVELPFVGEEVYGFFGFGGEACVVAEALEDIEVVDPDAVYAGFAA